MKLVLMFIVSMLLSSNQNEKSLEMIVNENKGKVIYVDYWASWCKPCRKEMRLIPKIRNMYKDKEIIYIYISLDLEKSL